MSSLMRTACQLFLVCSPIILAGCQTSREGQTELFHPASADFDARNKPGAPNGSLPANAQKEPSLTGQLGDALVLTLGTFTGK